jgi:hypothetical protein
VARSAGLLSHYLAGATGPKFAASLGLPLPLYFCIQRVWVDRSGELNRHGWIERKRRGRLIPSTPVFWVNMGADHHVRRL